MDLLNKSGVLSIKIKGDRKHAISTKTTCYVHILRYFDAIQIVKNTFLRDTFSASWIIMRVFIKY